MISLLYRYLSQTRGATAIEYGLIAGGIALAVAGSIFFLGDTLYEFFYSDLPDVLDSASS